MSTMQSAAEIYGCWSNAEDKDRQIAVPARVNGVSEAEIINVITAYQEGETQQCHARTQATKIEWTPELIGQVRNWRAEGLTNGQIAEKVGTTTQNIANIVHRHKMAATDAKGAKSVSTKADTAAAYDALSKTVAELADKLMALNAELSRIGEATTRLEQMTAIPYTPAPQECEHMAEGLDTRWLADWLGCFADLDSARRALELLSAQESARGAATPTGRTGN